MEGVMADKDGFVVTPADEPEYFHKLLNIEDYPEFLPTARKIADYYLANADYSDVFHREFSYSEEMFDKRMNDIYEGFAVTMFDPDWRDSGPLLYTPDKNTPAKLYPIGRMSDRVVMEGIKPNAPFNLVDGAWLNNIITVGPSN